MRADPSADIAARIAQTATSAPDRPAIVDRDGVTTYGQLWREATKWLDTLQQLGVQPAEAVGVLLPNHPTFVAALLGIARAGAGALLLPTSLEAVDLRRHIETAGARLVLTDASLSRRLAEAGGRPTAWDAGDVQLFAFGVMTPSPLMPGDFLVQLTSGTDQPSKLAVRTHRAVWQEIADFAEAIGLRPRDGTFVLSSIFHSYGLVGGTLAPLCVGGWVGLQQQFDPADALRLLTTHSPTILFAVPVTYRALVQSPVQPGEDLSSLRLCFSAGAPLSDEVDDAFALRSGRRIAQDYGSTEVGVITLRLQWAPHLRRSVGQPVRGRTVSIVDSRGRPLGPGMVGEVVVRSAALARVYLTPPSGGSVIAGDQLITGDLGWTDDDGSLYLTGRKTSLIHAGGVSINPAEVEAVIAAIPGVSDVAVVGVPDADHGEHVKAVVVAPALAAEDVLRHCRQYLAATHLPQVVEFRRTIPRTPAGKIIRRVLRHGRP